MKHAAVTAPMQMNRVYHELFPRLLAHLVDSADIRDEDDARFVSSISWLSIGDPEQQ